MKKYPWLIENEINALNKLKSKHFPKLISYDKNSILMENCGSCVTKYKDLKKNPNNRWDERTFTPMPDDFESQVDEILDELEKANLRHSDINHTHFLLKDGVVKLIDFEMCIDPSKPIPKNYMSTMGLEAKTRGSNEKIDDRLMAHRAINFLKNEMKEIDKALIALPNRTQYHELPFEIKQKTERRFMKERIELMEEVYDFKGKKGLDLGCNIGGISFSLAIKEANMTGVELTKRLLDVANACEEYFKFGVKFVESEICDYVLKNKNKYDFCTFLATWHWIVKQVGLKKATKVLNKVSKDCDVMFFETNFGPEPGLTGSEETMIEAGLTDEKKLIEFIKKNTRYDKVANIGKCIGWGGRSTYFCSKSQDQKCGTSNKKANMPKTNKIKPKSPEWLEHKCKDKDCKFCNGVTY